MEDGVIGKIPQDMRDSLYHAKAEFNNILVV